MPRALPRWLRSLLPALLLLMASEAVAQTGSALVSGSIFRGATVIGDLTSATPQFFVYDVTASQTVTGFNVFYDSSDSYYELSNLPSSTTLSITAVYHLTGSTSTLPGNYRGSTTVVTSSSSTFASIDVIEIMQLTLPWNNDAITFTIGGGYPTHLENLTFEWDPVVGATDYGLQVDRYRDPTHPQGYGFIANVQNQSLTGTAAGAFLPTLASDEIYQATVRAFDGQGLQIGQVWVTYTNGYGFDYRFKTASSPPTIQINGPTSANLNSAVTLTATAASCSPNPTGWSWSTGGGQITGPANGASIDVSWATTGVKAITARNTLCNATGQTTVNVSAPGALAADFRVDPSQPVAGAQARFFDQTPGNVTSWLWDFGDGTTSTLRNPRHTYVRAATYTVRLDVAGGGATGSVSRTVTVLPGGNTVELAEARFGAVEGERRVRITLRRSVASPTSAAVDVRVRESTAKFGSDISGPALRTVTWPANDASPKTLDIDLVDNGRVEPPEHFFVELENPRGFGLGSRRSATVVVSDDDFVVRVEPAISTAGENAVVAISREGLRAVVWQEPVGASFDIFGQVFGPDGNPLGPPRRLNARRSGNQVSPAVAWAGERLLVVWIDEGSSSSLSADGFIVSAASQSGNVVGAFLDPEALGSQSNRNVSEPGEEAENPQIAADPNGDVVVTWEDDRGPRGRVLDEQLQPRGPSFTLDPAQPGARRIATDKAVSGDFVSVWQLPGQGLRGRIFSERGVARGGRFRVTAAPGADDPVVAVAGDRSFFVAWAQGAQGSRSVRARRFDPKGRPLGPEFQLGRGRVGDRYAPSIDVNDAGDLVAVWVVEGAARSAAATKNTVGAFFDPTGSQIGNDVPIAGPQPEGDPAEPDVSIGDDDTTEVVITLRDPAGRAGGVIRRTVQPSLAGGPCVADAETLCLQDGRFRIRAEWQDRSGKQGVAGAEPMTGDTGLLWFFDEENVELVVKVLDGCGVNGRYWVFAGGLTDVEVTLRVDDTESGRSQIYSNRSRQAFQPLQDTSAFGRCSAGRPTSSVTAPARVAQQALACPPKALCLGNGRFQVTVDWRAQGSSGSGVPVPFSNDTGLFWFFDGSNLELVVKVLDGCGVNGSHWIFAGGLTNVRTEIRVRDVVTGRTRSYVNPQGRPFAPVQDTSGLGGC